MVQDSQCSHHYAQHTLPTDSSVDPIKTTNKNYYILIIIRISITKSLYISPNLTQQIWITNYNEKCLSTTNRHIKTFGITKETEIMLCIKAEKIRTGTNLEVIKIIIVQ